MNLNRFLINIPLASILLILGLMSCNQNTAEHSVENKAVETPTIDTLLEKALQFSGENIQQERMFLKIQQVLQNL